MMVVNHLISMVSNEIPVFYIPGNHDEMLRRFKGFQLGSLKITNKLSIKLNESKVWIFHGDVFDVVMQNSRWLARLGAIGYDALILINRMANFLALKMGYGNLSISKRVKNAVKGAVKFINDFENTVCCLASENKYNFVICGHIHHPEIKDVVTKNGVVTYMNSGDWIENLTALEYNDSKWTIYRYSEDTVAQGIKIDKKRSVGDSPKEMLESLILELKINQN